jgi:hypothetical protein
MGNFQDQSFGKCYGLHEIMGQSYGSVAVEQNHMTNGTL